MEGVDKVPVHETVSSVYYFSSENSAHNAVYLSKLQTSHSYIWEVSEAVAILEGVGYRYIVLSQLANVWRANSVDDGLGVDVILCDLLEVQAWQMSRTWGKIEICAKKEASIQMLPTSMHRDFVTTLYISNISHNIVGILTTNQRAFLTNLNLTESVKCSWCVRSSGCIAIAFQLCFGVCH